MTTTQCSVPAVTEYSSIEKPKPLKLFKAEHEGLTVFGVSVILATSRAQALKMMRKTLDTLKVGSAKVINGCWDDTIELTEIDMISPGVHVLFDGIY